MTKYIRYLLILGFFWLTTGNVLATAGINRKINFQGKVVNKGVSDGTNVTDGNYDFRFTLWSTLSAGTSIWTEGWTSGSSQVAVSNGIFTVALGTYSTFPPSVDFNSDSLFLSVNYNNDGDMTPRLQMAAVPYAFNAEKVGGLTVTNTNGTLTVANGVGISMNQSLSTGDTVTFAGINIGGTVAFTNIPIAVGTTVLFIDSTGKLSKGLLNSGSGTTYAVTNGLSVITANTFGLGGTLTQLTKIDLNSNNLGFFGTGNIGIGTTNPSQKLDVSGSVNIGGSLAVTVTTTTASITTSSSIIGSGFGTGDVYGFVNTSNQYGTGNNTYANKNTVLISSVLNTQTNKNIFGTQVIRTITADTNNLTVSNSIGSRIDAPTMTLANGGTLAITNQSGLYVYNQGGTYVTNSYGIYLENQVNSTNTYAIYTNAGKVYFGDNVNIGGSLGVTGNVGIGGSVTFSGLPIGVGTTILYIGAGGVLVAGTLPPGNTPYTANNGLSLNGSVFGLGGTLTQNTQIGTSSFGLLFVGVGGTKSLYIGVSGYIGIGTTNPAGSLHIWGNGTNGSNGQIYFGDRGNSGNPYIGEYGGTDTDQLLLVGKSGVIFNTSGADRMTIDSTGYLGIGTTAPSQKLDVNGSLKVGGSATIVSSINVGGSVTFSGLPIGVGTTILYIGTGGILVQGTLPPGGTAYTAANGLNLSGSAFGLGGTLTQLTKIDLNNNNFGFFGTGYVGIGTTNPNYTFEVVGDAMISTRLGIGATHPLYILNVGGTTNLTNLFVNGNVGIGTTNPLRKFQINEPDTGGTGPVFMVNTSGYLGIGTTNPGAFVDINNNGNNNIVLGDFKFRGGNVGSGAESAALFRITSNSTIRALLSVGTSQIGGGFGTGLFVTASNQVGVGTTSPLYPLHVEGSGTSGVAFFRNTIASGTTNPVIVIQAAAGAGTTGATSANEFIRFLNSAGAKAGRIRVGQTAASVVYSVSATADFAEYVLGNEPTEGGDLMAFDNGKYVKATLGKTLAGVHSAEPAFVGNENIADQPNAFPLAMSGVVRLKVSTINGPINPGDPLTASPITGVAAKAITAGNIVARATEYYIDSNPNKIGMIGVIANLSWYQPGLDISQKINLDIAQLKYQTNLDGVTMAVEEIKTSKISPLMDKNGNPVKLVIDNDIQINGDLSVGLLTADKIAANSIEGLDILTSRVDELEKNVKVLGDQVAVLATASASPAPTPTTIITENNIFKTLSEFWNGVVFKGEVLFEKSPIFGKDTAGIAIINAGETKVEIIFENEYADTPIVTVSLVADNNNENEMLTQGYSYFVSKNNNKGFSIVLNKPAINDVKFYWAVTAVRDVKTFRKSTPTVTLIPTLIEITPTIEASSSATIGL